MSMLVALKWLLGVVAMVCIAATVPALLHARRGLRCVPPLFLVAALNAGMAAALSAAGS
jgi:hypothetical protein